MSAAVKIIHPTIQSQGKLEFHMKLLSELIQKFKPPKEITEVILLSTIHEQAENDKTSVKFPIILRFFPNAKNSRCFTDIDECFTHIEHSRKVDIILLISASLIEQLEQSQKLKFPQIILSYQVDLSHARIEIDLTSRKKADHRAVVCSNLNHLQAIDNELGFYWGTFNPITADSNTSISYTRKVFEHLCFLEIIFHLITTDGSFQELIDSCKECLNDKHLTQEEIDRFAIEYKPERSIEWFTKQSFLYRIMTDKFRQCDNYWIFKTRHFLIDLYNEMIKRNCAYREYYNDYIKVYRGKTVTIDAFKQLQTTIGQLVITNSFLSTSLELIVAEFYVSEGSVGEGCIAVIIELVIDTRVNSSKSFAYIADRSSNRSEVEILLSPGMVFRNKKIESNQGKYYIVTLERGAAEVDHDEYFIRRGATHFSNTEDIATVDNFIGLTHPTSLEIPQEKRDPSTSPATAATSTETISARTHVHTMKKQFLKSEFGSHMIRLVFRQMNELRNKIRSEGSSSKYTIFKDFFDDEDDDYEFTSNIAIIHLYPIGEPYHVAGYALAMELSETYPFRPPNCHILTPIYHPNIGEKGCISTPILTDDRQWLPRHKLQDCIERVIACLEKPDPIDVLNPEAANEYMNNFELFKEKARSMAIKYGIPKSP